MKTAPDEILRITRCSCNASHCETSACSCHSARIPCSQFCGCHQNGCNNKWNKLILELDEDGYDEQEIMGNKTMFQ